MFVVIAAAVLFWFQPQKLYIDDSVNETIPTAGRSAASTPPRGGDVSVAPSVAESPDPVELARGEFVSLDHATTGVARVLELADGSRVLRIEDLDTDNGPDLFVYLTENPASGDEAAFDDHHLNLGRLKGNHGDQNYDIPAGTDPDFRTVVIWCDRFDSAFGAADLDMV